MSEISSEITIDGEPEGLTKLLEAARNAFESAHANTPLRKEESKKALLQQIEDQIRSDYSTYNRAGKRHTTLYDRQKRLLDALIGFSEDKESGIFGHKKRKLLTAGYKGAMEEWRRQMKASPSADPDTLPKFSLARINYERRDAKVKSEIAKNGRISSMRKQLGYPSGSSEIKELEERFIEQLLNAKLGNIPDEESLIDFEKTKEAQEKLQAKYDECNVSADLAALSQSTNKHIQDIIDKVETKKKVWIR